jgi:carboxylesterase type B
VDVPGQQYWVRTTTRHWTPDLTDAFCRNNGTYALTPFTTASQKSFAKELIAYWLSFVRSGDPNTYALPGSPKWPTWDNAKYLGRRMVLKQGGTVELDEGGVRYVSGSKVEIVDGAEVTRCKEVNKLASRFHF